MMKSNSKNEYIVTENIREQKLMKNQEFPTLEMEKKRESIMPLVNNQIINGFVSTTDYDHWISNYKDQSRNSRDNVVELLKNISLFYGLNNKTLMQLAYKMTCKYYQAGECIYHDDSNDSSMYIIETGLVNLILPTGNGEDDVTSINAGDFFGLHAVLAGCAFSRRAVAVIDSTLWCIDRNDLLQLLKDNPEIGLVTSHHLSCELQKTECLLKDGKKDFNSSNVISVIIDHEYSGIDEISCQLLEQVLNESEGDTLLILGVPLQALPDTLRNDFVKRTETNVTHLRSGSIINKKKGNLAILYLPGQDKPDFIDQISRCIGTQSSKFNTVFILTTMKSMNSITYLSTVSKRLALILDRTIPDTITTFKPGRNRIYLLQSDAQDHNVRKYQEVVTRLKGNEMVAAPNMLKPAVFTKCLGQIVRWLYGRSIGVAFGGGGARTIPQMSMLKVLEQEGFIIDAVSGSSFGALTAAMKALGMNGTEIISYFEKELLRKGKSPFSDWSIPLITGSVSRGKNYKKLVKNAVQHRHCLETEIAYFPIATSMEEGTEVVVRHAPVLNAVLASGATPGFLPLVKYQGVYMGDGGMVDNVPALPLKEYGCDFVISFNASEKPGKVGLNPKSFASNLWIGFDIVLNQSTKKHLNYTDFELRPPIDGFSLIDFTRGHDLLRIGEQYIEEKIDELKKQAAKAGITVKSNGGV